MEDHKKTKFDPLKGWDRFSQRIENEQHQHTIKLKWIKYAAVLFIPVALASVLMISNHQKEQNANDTCITVVNAGTGQLKKVTLPDSSNVWLNAESELHYSCSFKGKAERSVSLVRGEAYFDVQHNSKKPFIVKLNKMSIKVYGTKFNVNSYTEEVKTTLITGSIGATSSGKELMLKPGQQATLNPEKEIFAVKHVSAENDALWHTGVLNFDNITVKEISAVLARQYGYTFSFQSKELSNLHLTFIAKLNDGLPEILSKLSMVSGIKFNIHHKTVLVHQ